jgi:hypothetical protein
MVKKHSTGRKNKILLSMVCIVLATVSGIYFWTRVSGNSLKAKRATQQQEQQSIHPDDEIYRKIPQQRIIDFDRLGEDEKLQAVVKERKDQFGLDKGVDLIVRADESLKLGDSIIPMREILEKVRIRQGSVIEEGLAEKVLEENVVAFGIYVVKPNDNLWNIHFQFLKDYFDRKNIPLSPMADKPDERGYSSGVGKILKFSENIVYIYNTRDRKLYADLNLLNPESEIVVFHMEEIFLLLDQIDLHKVDHIRFDGQNLWIPSKS